MALIDMFERRDGEAEHAQLLTVLNEGLDGAEGGGLVYSSGGDDLRIQFCCRGEREPEWLHQVNPELAKVYRDWAKENSLRIEAVLKKEK